MATYSLREWGGFLFTENQGSFLALQLRTEAWECDSFVQYSLKAQEPGESHTEVL